jgi:hypothetical protein
MKDLNLPKITDPIFSTNRILSMDEYVEFVQFHLENLFDKKSYLRWKKIISVNVPFKLID